MEPRLSKAMTQSNRIAAPYSTVNLTASDLNHTEWTRAAPVHITRKWTGEAAPESRHAEARILWTEQSLVVRFVCRQEEALNVNADPRRDQKRMRLWDKDVCEIFVAPEARVPERYFEFEAAPTGEWIDLAITFSGAVRDTDFEFRSGMTTASSNSGGTLIVTICIPWGDALPKPQRGDVWRVNLFRCVGFGDERYLAWLPTYAPEPSFHVPEVFGWLEFV